MLPTSGRTNKQVGQNFRNWEGPGIRDSMYLSEGRGKVWDLRDLKEVGWASLKWSLTVSPISALSSQVAMSFPLWQKTGILCEPYTFWSLVYQAWLEMGTWQVAMLNRQQAFGAFWLRSQCHPIGRKKKKRASIQVYPKIKIIFRGNFWSFIFWMSVFFPLIF